MILMTRKHYYEEFYKIDSYKPLYIHHKHTIVILMKSGSDKIFLDL
jgi:hypothetical protein